MIPIAKPPGLVHLKNGAREAVGGLYRRRFRQRHSGDDVLAARAEAAFLADLFAILPAASALDSAGGRHGDSHLAEAADLGARSCEIGQRPNVYVRDDEELGQIDVELAEDVLLRKIGEESDVRFERLTDLLRRARGLDHFIH